MNSNVETNMRFSKNVVTSTTLMHINRQLVRATTSLFLVEQFLSMARWRAIVTLRTTDVSSLAQCALYVNRNAIMRYTTIAFKMEFIMYIAAII